MTQTGIEPLLEAIPLPALVIGRAERILGANERALDLLGTGIAGRHFITAIRQPVVLDTIEASLRDGQPREARYLSSDGAQDTTYIVTCSYVAATVDAGVLVCFEDITHVEMVGQMRRDFVANVSHELRTPLTAILGFIETLQGPARDDRLASDRFLETMHIEATRMERLVKDLLSLNRVEAQERNRPTETLDLAALLRSVVDATGPIVRGANVQLHVDLPDDILVLPGDADQLRQVFTNLIENAVKYGGPNKEITLDARCDNPHPALRVPSVTVSVTDQGPGIEEVHIPRLTERFYRVDNHRSREMGGTGLGLAIVKHIVNRHRGRLRIDSTEGEGSRFTVILPLDTRPPAA
ncbi:MAG: ATP-binding protein [Pseudomonadota bacterium]